MPRLLLAFCIFLLAAEMMEETISLALSSLLGESAFKPLGSGKQTETKEMEHA